MSWMDDILDHVLGTTDQAPPGAKPDVAIRNPKTFRNLKGTREIRMQRSGEADKGIQAPEGKRDLRGDKKGTLQRKGYYMVQPAVDPSIKHRELLEIFKGLSGGSNQP